MIMLRRTDAERNMHRFYALGLMPTLFGEWALIAEWGRIGSPGRVQRSTYADEVSAMKALASRLAEKSRRGYRSAVTTLVRSYLRVTWRFQNGRTAARPRVRANPPPSIASVACATDPFASPASRASVARLSSNARRVARFIRFTSTESSNRRAPDKSPDPTRSLD